jgi:hypothetical protein
MAKTPGEEQGVRYEALVPNTLDLAKRARLAVNALTDAGDMVNLAIKLSDAEVGGYWEDVDQYVRNDLAEVQLLRRDLLEAISEAAQKLRTSTRCGKRATT